MADYKKMYFTLFHAVTDVVTRLEKSRTASLADDSNARDILWAKNKLINAQLACEEIFIDTDDESIYDNGM